ncbi:hypothetical protein OG874_00415 [Nocardia sp. NBC_00565]|uniref:hypothetical protein n=1 Tax=Nocardia sp. NBC_00565 TaxID=2975993 RepID=UPI002E7FF25A|nr:hypothetical protein [Nocardia sp. NBC_00565]WUC03718.1 hypothetical protein OG874_00415 [Nocardia sp. NBC_00565]
MALASRAFRARMEAMLRQHLAEWQIPEDPMDASRWIHAETVPGDDIDALVVDQMRDGEPATGYDFNDPTFPVCPHPWCGEHWHGLAITRRMRQMRARGDIDPDYRYVDDNSEVLCPGSLFEGEFEPPSMPVAQHLGAPVLINESDYALLGTPDRDTLYMIVPEPTPRPVPMDDVTPPESGQWFGEVWTLAREFRLRPLHDLMHGILADADLTWTPRDGFSSNDPLAPERPDAFVGEIYTPGGDNSNPETIRIERGDRVGWQGSDGVLHQTVVNDFTVTPSGEWTFMTSPLE